MRMAPVVVRHGSTSNRIIQGHGVGYRARHQSGEGSQTDKSVRGHDEVKVSPDRKECLKRACI